MIRLNLGEFPLQFTGRYRGSERAFLVSEVGVGYLFIFTFKEKAVSHFISFSSFLFLRCLGGDYLKFFLHLEEDGVNELTPWNSLLCGQAQNQSFYSSGRHLIIQFHSGPGTPRRTQGNSDQLGFLGHFRYLNSSKCSSLCQSPIPISNSHSRT
jgi:hypothetical protein